MIEIFKSFIFIFAWVIFIGLFYGMYLTLKHKNMEKEFMRRCLLKNRDCLNKDK